MNREAFTIIKIILALIVSIIFFNEKAHSQIMSVTVHDIKMLRKERVVGFEIRIRSGRIALLPNIPVGWEFSVDNDPSWNTTLRASVKVGAAATDPDFFQDFIVIELEKNAPTEAPFLINGEVIVTSDFTKERRINLLPENFTIRGH